MKFDELDWFKVVSSSFPDMMVIPWKSPIVPSPALRVRHRDMQIDDLNDSMNKVQRELEA